MRLMGIWVASACLAAAAAWGDEPRNEKTVAIFDGKSLEGWEGNLEWFRARDGAVVAGTLDKAIPRNEFLCTKKSYSDFELRLKVKLLGGEKANAGVQFRTKRIPNHHEVSGYQADMGDGWWGTLYDESRRNKPLVAAKREDVEKILKRDDWNEYRIRCQGDHIELWLNGFKTVDYKEQDPAIERSGIIGLQIHGGPASEAWYKDIVIEELK